MTTIPGIKFLLVFYVIFVTLLVFFDINEGTGLSVPNPPDLKFSTIFDSELGEAINSLKASNPIGFLIGSVFEVVTIIKAILAYFLNIIFFVVQMFTFTIPGQDLINFVIVFTRIVIILELIVYIKNMINPVAEASS